MTAPTDNTPAAVIEDGLFDAGILQEGQSPNSEQLVRGMRVLTDLINIQQTQGLKLWLNVDTAVTLTAGTGTYTFGPAGTVVMAKPLRVLQAYFLDSSSIHTPLIALSRDEYLRLSDTTQQGALNSYFVDKRDTVLAVSFYLIPDSTAATGTAHLLFQLQVTNFTGLTDTMNFPIEWRMYLRWGLADESCTGQPTAIMERCQQRAEMYRAKLEDFDVEDASTSFAPDSRGQYWSQRFR